MTTLTIVRLGFPTLRTPARPIPPQALSTPEIQGLIDDLIETMRGARGVGLAAPQVGKELQIFVYEAEKAADREEIPLRVVVNPMLTPQLSDVVYDWEGCLSIPDLRGLVPRHPVVRVQGLDREGRPVDYVASGFEARVVQHEFDHLNGVVFLDRMRDFQSLTYTEEWEDYMMAGQGVDLDDTAVG